jgi:hypothetical protein
MQNLCLQPPPGPQPAMGYQGTPHSYYPDYLVRLANCTTLVLEVKGQDDQQNRTKREFLDEWVRAVNAHGGFGKWVWAVSKNPADLSGILHKLNDNNSETGKEQENG